MEIQINKEKIKEEGISFILSWIIIIGLGAYTLQTKNILPAIIYLIMAAIYWTYKLKKNNESTKK